MLTFQTQQKILNNILKNPSNNMCADCNTSSPTWASLDFGVFLCSNCSGAHRGLGPTITRVKSTKLDLWHKDWIDNMKIGNLQLNNYWQAQLSLNFNKPKMGSPMAEINKFVNEKYIKKRFVKKNSGNDPLTVYKMGLQQGVYLQKNEHKNHSPSQSEQKFRKNELNNKKQLDEIKSQKDNENSINRYDQLIDINDISNTTNQATSLTAETNNKLPQDIFNPINFNGSVTYIIGHTMSSVQPSHHIEDLYKKKIDHSNYHFADTNFNHNSNHHNFNHHSYNSLDRGYHLHHVPHEINGMHIMHDNAINYIHNGMYSNQMYTYGNNTMYRNNQIQGLNQISNLNTSLSMNQSNQLEKANYNNITLQVSKELENSMKNKEAVKKEEAAWVNDWK